MFQQFCDRFSCARPAVRRALGAEAERLGPTGLRRKRDDGTPRLEVIDRLPLTPHHSLHLVRLADRTLLIGLSPNGCNLLESAQIALPSPVRQEN